jgi:hypothetical protein
MRRLPTVGRAVTAVAVLTALVLAAVALTSAGGAERSRPGAYATLSQAAGQQVGSALTRQRPAAAVSGGDVRVEPRDVLPRRARVNGCLPEYGHGGQCVPRRAPGGAAVTCRYVRTILPQGVMVHGTDRFGLDRNGDGIACGRGDGD